MRIKTMSFPYLASHFVLRPLFIRPPRSPPHSPYRFPKFNQVNLLPLPLLPAEALEMHEALLERSTDEPPLLADCLRDHNVHRPRPL